MTNNQEMIQQLMDEGVYAPLYPLVLESHLNDFQKLLISLMLNDIRMNGNITWKQSTYASKTNKNRKTIVLHFRILTELGILIPESDNKVGGKSNKYTISFSAITDYKPVTSQSKPVTSQSKPVTSQSKPVTSQSKPVTPVLHIKKDKEINKETYKEIINNLKGEITSYDDFLNGAKEDNKTKEEIDLDLFLQSLDN